jgi:hypothetical protein
MSDLGLESAEQIKMTTSPLLATLVPPSDPRPDVVK